MMTSANTVVKSTMMTGWHSMDPRAGACPKCGQRMLAYHITTSGGTKLYYICPNCNGLKSAFELYGPMESNNTSVSVNK